MSRRAFVLATWAIVLVLMTALGPGSGPPGATAGGALAAPLAVPPAAPDNSVVLQPFLSGLSAPAFITHAGDGSGRLFVVELSGKIKVVKNGTVNPTPFLDVGPLITVGGESGLLGLAFHPNYESNGRFFIYYTAKPPPPPTTNVGSNTLAEYHVMEGDPDRADPVPVRTLISIADAYANHNGGMIGFGPDGYLYVGMGDEGNSHDTPKNNAQNLATLYGKILRIDVDTLGTPDPPGFGYSIPASNPFSDRVAHAGKRPEIWAIGLRNPWRWSFDRLTGQMFIGDVGQGSWEEINLLPRPPDRGATTPATAVNLGWRIREGAHCTNLDPCTTAGLTDPILEYSRAANESTGAPCTSITGGYRYRGSAYPAFQGTYFYGDYCSGRIWKGIFNGSSWTAVEVLDGDFGLSSFGEDEAGELYVVMLGGSIFRLAQAPPSSQPCDPDTRPRVIVQTTSPGPGLLNVVVSATLNATITSNALQSIAFPRIDNASVTIGSQVDQQAPFTVTLPPGTPTTRFTVRRKQAGVPMHVGLSITDACGPWSSFVGAGTSGP